MCNLIGVYQQLEGYLEAVFPFAIDMPSHMNKIRAEGPELSLPCPVSEGFCLNFPLRRHCWMPSSATSGCPANLCYGIPQFCILWHVVFHA